MNTPKVTLMTWTQRPLETVYAVWQASKNIEPLMSIGEVRAQVPKEDVEQLFRAVVAQRIPIGEHINFVFMLENVSMSWREHAVRHRIGTKASPERLGSDMVHVETIPDLADSSFWSQSMRIQDMGAFADQGAYRIPESLVGKSCEFLDDTGCVARSSAMDLYNETMAVIQHAYKALVAAGVPMEDARELIPVGVQHRMSWSLNMSALQHIIGKRGCWILQLGTWGPVIRGMVRELVEKVSPIFQELIVPPCIDPEDDEFIGCAFREECRRRLTGDDALPPCPLHLAQEQCKDPDWVRLNVAKEDFRILNPRNPAGKSVELPRRSEMLDRIESYTRFWGRDVYTGERIR